jgi:hypothetical protein
LAAPEPDPGKIIRKGKNLEGASSSNFSGTSGDLPDSVFHTSVVVSHFSHLPTVETPVNSKLGSFLVEYSTFSLEMKEESLENFDFLASPKILKWFRIGILEYFPLLSSPSPHPFKFSVTKEKGTSVSIEIPPSSSKAQRFFVKSDFFPPFTLPFLKLPIIHNAYLLVKSPSTSPRIQSPPFRNQMTGVNHPQNRMDAIVVARYAPLLLPQPMNSLPIGYYLKYMSKFTGEEDIIA